MTMINTLGLVEECHDALGGTCSAKAPCRACRAHAAMINRAVENVKAEIRSAVERKSVPGTVTTFSGLHDHLDPNVYLTRALGPAPVVGSDEATLRVWLDNANAVINRIDQWLADGRSVARIVASGGA